MPAQIQRTRLRARGEVARLAGLRYGRCCWRNGPAPALMVGAEGVLVPYAAQAGAPDAAGLLFAAVAAGMFAGNLPVGRLVRPAGRELAGPLALAVGLPLPGFALHPAPGYAATLMTVSGSASPTNSRWPAGFSARCPRRSAVGRSPCC